MNSSSWYPDQPELDRYADLAVRVGVDLQSRLVARPQQHRSRTFGALHRRTCLCLRRTASRSGLGIPICGQAATSACPGT